MKLKSVMVTGGAGYVGTTLVPKLLAAGYQVKVLDWYIFGKDYFKKYRGSSLKEIEGDIRDKKLLLRELTGADAVIHLACLASDQSFDLDPKFSRSVNFDGTKFVFDVAKKTGVKRFIYASTSAVYGIKKEKKVTEDRTLEPITEYSRFKMLCEKYIRDNLSESMTTVIIRPAAICGYSPRLRLDLSVNTLTIHALVNHKIIVNGGEQERSQINVEDISDLYIKLLEYPSKKIHGKIYNASFGNFRIIDIARLIEKELKDKKLKIEIRPLLDNRSYHISGERIKKELGYVPKYSVIDAVWGIKKAYDEGLIKDPLINPVYSDQKMVEKMIRKVNKKRFL